MPKISKIIILVLIFVIPILLLTGIQIRYLNSSYPNIYVGNIPVGGKSRNQLEKILQKETELIENKTISFSINKSSYLSIKLNKNLLSYNNSETINQIMSYGRTGSIQNQIKERIALLSTKHTIKPSYTFDNLTFDTLLADIVRDYEKPVHETQLIYTSQGLALTPSKAGVNINRDIVLNQIKNDFEFTSTSGIIELTLEVKQPEITRENSQEILELAKRAVSKPITLYSKQIPEKTWTLDAPQMYEFLEIKYDKDKKKPILSLADYKIASYSSQFKPLIQKDIKEAKYETIGDKVVVIEEAEDGYELDSEKLTSQLTHAVFGSSQTNKIDLPIKTLKPAIASLTVNQYGIKEIIASGTSYFKGSSPARIHNIEIAAQKLNGTIIKSGEIFSMYKAIGNIEKSTGFEDSFIIKNGRTVIGVGGGVCQVSSTLFRAVLNAGFKINERHPHSYRVSYYEQESSPGFDAAIFFPQSDFKFTNNTSNYALIQTKIDKEKSQLTFNIYGVNDGRRVEISTAQVTNRIDPPKEARIPDPSLARGTIRQTEFAAQGSDVTFTRKVTINDQIISNDTFKSHYYPWQAVYYVGIAEN